MSKARLCVLVCALALSVVSLASAGEHLYGFIRLVGIESAEVEGRFDGIKAAVKDGHLKLAARGDESSYFYAGPKGERLLQSLGITHEIIMEDVGSLEIYMVPRGEDHAALPAEYQSWIVKKESGLYLVAVEEGEAVGIHMLPLKKRLPLPMDADLPLLEQREKDRAPGRMLSGPPTPIIYDPDIQAMVDAVSQSRLYSTLSDLSGENSVVVGGQTYTINTRYTPNPMCRIAGQYLLETFEDMGLDVEYDYFRFFTQVKRVVFPEDNQTGWAIGRAGLILKTYDGGLNWDEQDSGLDTVLWDIVMHDNTSGCIAGNYGVVLKTDDGVNWQEVSTPTSNDLFGIHFSDASTGFCCGENGTILRTLNGGSSWSSVSSGTSQDLNSIWFTSVSVGWVVGDYGVIRKTTDGGASWSSVSSPVGYDLFDLCFDDANTGWISGGSGTVLKTEDGSNWSVLGTPTSEDLLSVFFVTDQIGWICGTGGALYKTWNGGSTWIDLNYEYTVNLRDIFFVNNTEGWMSGLGLIYRSTDGGASWVDQEYGIHSGDVNVVATKPGTTNPEEIYIICGHYDSISNNPDYLAPGADDNGTGTVGVLEAAWILRDYDFEATIRFICFSREEQGLVGSAAYAQEAKDKGDSIIAVLNFDMIGYEDVDPEDLNIICNTPSIWLGDQFEAAAGLYVPELSIHRQVMSRVGSDNSSFWDRGYDGFCGIEDSPLNNPYYHRTTDNISTIDFDFYVQSVKGAIASLAELARPDDGLSGVVSTVEPRVLKAAPNPGRGMIAFEMKTDGPQPVRFDIYDVNGRHVKTLGSSVDGGMARATWAGDDVAGSPVGAGIYFVRTGGQTQGTKVILLK
jgi:photosystem II stability/assembly factor-like uncharacterized protein